MISTVNVQHLESLNDVVERITGIAQRETVPDAVVRSADQIELVDMTPEALRRRMAHGNIYAAEKVDAALATTSAPATSLLSASSPCSGSQIESTKASRTIATATASARPGRARASRRGPDRCTGRRAARQTRARMAARTHADLVGVHVHPSDGLDEGRQDLLDRHRALLEQLGGRYAEVTGSDIADALVRSPQAENATQLILGASKRSRWAELTQGSVINRAIKQSGRIDVHVISTDATAGSPRETPEHDESRALPGRPARGTIAWALALGGVPLFTVALLPFKEAIGVPGMLLLLMLLPVAIAVLGGLRPALVGSAVAYLCADWFFIEPTHSLRFARGGRARARVFVAVSSLVSGLVDRLARRSSQLAKSQAETEALAELASGTALLDEDSLHRLVVELRVALALESVAVLAPTLEGWRVEASSGEPVPASPEGASYSAELASGSVLVVKGPSLPAEDRRLLSAFVAHLRLAQDTLRLQAAALEAGTLAEGNRLREALLAAVSHDLRGPLANIKAAASSLLSEDVEWPPEEVRSFCTTIDAEADRLHAVVSNLLDMGRLQAGMVGVRVQPTVVEEVIYAALASLSVDVSTVEVDVSDDLPSVLADPTLLERAVANVILNALGWAPEGPIVRVEVGVAGGKVDIRTIDRGAGIPRDQRDAVFRPFQRLGDGGHLPYEGIGLGLAVTKGFVEAMGGEVRIDDTPGGGTTVTITVTVTR